MRTASTIAFALATTIATTGCSLIAPLGPEYSFEDDAGMDGGRVESDAGTDASFEDADVGTDAGPTQDAGRACGGCPAGTSCFEDLGRCGVCRTSADCAPPQEHCRDTDLTCVECLAPAHCTDSTNARCEDGSCVPCTVDEDCVHLTGTPVCDEATGHCGACSPASESTDCGSTSTCDPSALTCTGEAPGSLNTCESCVTDSECGTGYYCVPTHFGASLEDAGSYCLADLDELRSMWGSSFTCEDLYPGEGGLPEPIDTASVLGRAGTYCSPTPTLTTCAALWDYHSTCPTGDTDCGVPGLDDGLCVGGRCSNQCDDAADCPGNACDSSAAPPHCYDIM